MKKTPGLKTVFLLLTAAVFLYSLPIVARESRPSDTLTLSLEQAVGLFDTEEVLDITIKFDVTEYMRKKPDEYMDAVITFYNAADDSVSYDIRLRARGVRRRELCTFPPIRLNFKNTSTIYGDIDSISNIKMVTHCNTPSSYQNYVLKEYLLYKMYNIVTDYSFRVRLLRVKYIDTGDRGRFYSKYGFLIEPMDLLERRLNVFEIENIYLRYENLVPDLLDRMAIFQYMIGNTDWQVISYHNIKIVKGRDQEKGVAIPYDFDYSGFVNTSYAVPSELFEIKNVKERLFLGACRPDSTYRRIIGEFEDKRDNFYSLKDRCELIDERSARYVNDYLDSFFKLCERDRLVNIFLMQCKDR
ncbi:MAG: hypothetical protein KFF49_10660 [Bacteroidales bacterium]|nr:hypothetical protein [Bacteroidales bacterium]